MPEIALIALYTITVLLVLIFATLIRIASKLSAMERQLADSTPSCPEKESAPETSHDGAFGKFLGDHPELLAMKKSEQFAAFRAWRKEQGLNWEGK